VWWPYPPSQRGKLEQLITQYPDVLTEKSGLTHLVEYQIKLLENIPVRLAQYRFLFCRVALQPNEGQGPLIHEVFEITHNDALQSVGLLCTSDQLVAETST